MELEEERGGAVGEGRGDKWDLEAEGEECVQLPHTLSSPSLLSLLSVSTRPVPSPLSSTLNARRGAQLSRGNAND
eukprot:771865-Rhodomonas_salina.1